jgi:hypothetical protein
MQPEEQDPSAGSRLKVLRLQTRQSEFICIMLITWKFDETGSTLFKNLKISESEQVQILDKIQKANQFHEFIDKPRSEVKNNLYINSTCKNTEYSVEQQKEFHVPGDGRVTAEASIPNDFDQNIEKIFTHCSAHDQQLNDPIIYDKLVEFINK